MKRIVKLLGTMLMIGSLAACSEFEEDLWEMDPASLTADISVVEGGTFNGKAFSPNIGYLTVYERDDLTTGYGNRTGKYVELVLIQNSSIASVECDADESDFVKEVAASDTTDQTEARIKIRVSSIDHYWKWKEWRKRSLWNDEIIYSEKDNTGTETLNVRLFENVGYVDAYIDNFDPNNGLVSFFVDTFDDNYDFGPSSFVDGNNITYDADFSASVAGIFCANLQFSE